MKAIKRKKMTQATKIRQYMAKHPKAMPMEIAKALGVKVEYVHVLRWAEKKKAQAKKTTVSASEVIAAQKKGISIEEVARKKIAKKKAKTKKKLNRRVQKTVDSSSFSVSTYIRVMAQHEALFQCRPVI